MNKIIAILLLLINFNACYSQQLRSIPNAPSNEIYDMLIDSKGFLWIAHSLGISKFDGVNFTNYSSIYQSAVGTSGLLEDKYGRIWFHNFNGQVFYIQHEKMEYLKEYDYKNSHNFPRIVIYGDELAITSSKGLFLCNLNTLKCRMEYLNNDNPRWGITSFCVINGKLLGHSSYYEKSIWASYSPATGLREIKGDDDFFLKKPIVTATINVQSFFDTAIIINKGVNGNVIYGVTLKNDKLAVAFKKETKAYINTVSIVDNKLWINTRSGSFALRGNDTLKGNITSILEGSSGNLWYSSLVSGLFLLSKNQTWKPRPVTSLQKNDYVQCMLFDNNNLITCSQLGDIFSRESHSGKFIKITSIPVSSGAPENIEKAECGKFFIFTTSMLYMLDCKLKKLLSVDSSNIKSISVAGKSLLLATSFGLKVKKNPLFNGKSSDSFFVSTEYKRPPLDYALYKEQRCRAVLFDSITKETYVSFTSGLEKIKNGVTTPVLYNNREPLYVSSMTMSNGKIYAGTFNNGLFIINKDSVIKIKNDTESPLDAITKIKNCRYHLWLFRTHDIELLDKLTGRFVSVYSLPASVPDILDVEEDSLNIYLATTKGVFTMPFIANTRQDKKPITLIYALVNNKDTLFTGYNSLKSNENNLLFRLAIPIYDNADKIHFKYMLSNGSEDTTWYYTHDAQRDIQFNALKPGSYTFKVIAIKDNEVVSPQPLIYRFTISPPWYNTIAFYIAVVLAVIALSIGVQQYRLRQVLKIERVRRKISNDLHDDIGSTLSSINIYSQLAKTEKDNKEYVDTIQQNAVSIIGNLDDLVWNINPKNDVLENMITRMRLFAEPLLAEKNIECVFTVNTQDQQLVTSPDFRTNVYLLFKEIINNVIKHSQSNRCLITITQKGKQFTLDINDNGRGFDSQVINRHRNGLHSIQQRVKDLKGTLNINSQPGQGTHIITVCQVK